MGSGCSSPLRRLGGKRAKQTQRDSVSDIIGDKDNPEQLTIAAKIQAASGNKESPAAVDDQRVNLNLENEITIQSEANEDHASSVSYYTDGKNANENGHRQPASNDHGTADQPPKSVTSAGSAGGAVARMMGLTGAIPYDRHLLVSPALSPAPSICQSPAPTSSYAGCPVTLDLNDLDEAFMTLTFGSAESNQQQHNQTRRRIIRKARTTQHSDLYNYHNQQLLQSREDLTQNVSVVFIASDNITENISRSASSPNSIDLLASQVELSLRSICDDRSYNMRFLNLSQDHLSKNLFINNMQDVARKMFEEEYRENGHRMLVIMLANSNTSLGTNETNQSESVLRQHQQLQIDKRQLPTRIDVQVMNKLLNYDQILINQESKDLLKLWYNLVGTLYYLKPIYLVYPKISSKSREERESAWQSWLADSNIVIKTLVSICENDAGIGSELSLRSLFNTYTDFIIGEPPLQRRTLLIRNYSGLIMSSQNAQQVTTLAANKLNELARLLADPCKLVLKHTSSEEEFSKLVSDWISENFNKYMDGFIEARVSSGKCVPPFIERNLFIELTRQRHYLEHYLDSITENFESKCHSFYTSQIEPILAKFAEVSPDTASSTNLSSSRQSLSSQAAANHLVFISGPKGSGKTTLFAQLIKNAVQELSSKAQIIYRFCGLTMDSLNSNRLLRSICEQFCQTHGENTAAASYIYSSRRKELMDAIGKIVKLRNVLILLDGINLFNDPVETCLEWLCEIEASSHIKIIMTLETDTELYKKILNNYTDATFITLNNPTSSEWAHMLTSAARSHRYNSTGNLYEELKQLDSAKSDNVSVNFGDASDVLNICRMRILNNEHMQPELTTKMVQMNSLENFKTTHKVILEYLHYLMPPYLVCSLLVALDTSRNGLSELEIIEIISLMAKKYYDIKQHSFKISASHLNYLKYHLRPWLRVFICDRVVKFALMNDLLSRAIEFYVTTLFPKIVGEVREILESYYGKPFKQLQRGSRAGIGVSDQQESSPSRIRDHVSYAEAIWLETQASEMMNLLILTNPTKAKSNILNKQTFYLQFLRRSMPEEFVEDYDRLRALSGRKLSQNEEIQNLVNYIRQSIFPLRYDGSQIYSQIYCRSFDICKPGSKSTKSKKFNDILSTALSPPIWSLLPVSEISIDSFIKTRIGQIQPSSGNNGVPITTPSILGSQKTSVLPSNQLRQLNGPVNPYQQASRQKIFTIKENHRHVIAIYPGKNSLAVWDIFEERAVRIINDIDHPRDLRMIDQKRAVILCNRELRVYDLDSGVLVTKLKGVMNQKMPYFEIFGQDYVIALARNRMYVNMLNIKTGELETTFKVGEDRFLNSLLVSADGGICVCGDETQKPFPLLVWNLNERRLMYDLRLDRHEFITSMSAISDDGHFVVSVCKQLGDSNDSASAANSGLAPTSAGGSKTSTNFIVIYDLNSGTLFKKWKPGLDTCGVAISLSSNRSGKLINSITDSSILVWDLTTGSKKHTLIGHSAPPDKIRVQNNRLFSMDSTCRDQSLRIWDIEEGYCMAVFSPDAPISCCQMSIRGDALVCGFATEFRLSTLILCKNESVGDVVKRNKRRKSSKSLYIFDEPPSRKPSS